MKFQLPFYLFMNSKIDMFKKMSFLPKHKNEVSTSILVKYQNEVATSKLAKYQNGSYDFQINKIPKWKLRLPN